MSCCGQKRTELKQNGQARAGQARAGSVAQRPVPVRLGGVAQRGGPSATLLLSYLARNAARRGR